MSIRWTLTLHHYSLLAWDRRTLTCLLVPWTYSVLNSSPKTKGRRWSTVRYETYSVINRDVTPATSLKVQINFEAHKSHVSSNLKITERTSRLACNQWYLLEINLWCLQCWLFLSLHTLVPLLQLFRCYWSWGFEVHFNHCIDKWRPVILPSCADHIDLIKWTITFNINHKITLLPQ